MKKFYQHLTLFRGLVGLLLLPILGFQQVTYATGFSVSPIKVNLSEDKKVVSLRVYNNDSKPASIQAELVQWQQKDGVDIQQELAHDLLVTPPIFTLEPGGTQVLRVGMRRSADVNQELSYRLFLQEIPTPNNQVGGGLTMLMRISLPVFIKPTQQKQTSALEWGIKQLNDREWALTVNNSGAIHSQITELDLQFGDEEVVNKKGNFYVLPGSSVQLIFKTKKSINMQQPIELKAKTSSGSVRSTVQMSE